MFLALGGTGYAATRLNVKQVTKLITQLAPSLSVKHAKTANTARVATTAGSSADATNATNATDATNATRATNAGNATDLGGLPASAHEPSDTIVTGGGEHLLSEGQENVTIAAIGHFTFTASCTNVDGQPQIHRTALPSTTFRPAPTTRSAARATPPRSRRMVRRWTSSATTVSTGRRRAPSPPTRASPE